MTYIERLRKCPTEILQREIHCQKKQIEIAKQDLATMERALAERLRALAERLVEAPRPNWRPCGR